MSGEKLVAVVSDAASTGISLHASAEAGNRRRRMHFTCEVLTAADQKPILLVNNSALLSNLCSMFEGG